MGRTRSGGGSRSEADEGAISDGIRSVNQCLSLPLPPPPFLEEDSRRDVVLALEGLTLAWSSHGPMRLAWRLLLWLTVPRGGTG